MDITSKYKGVVVKLHYKARDVAHVGKALVDIRVDEAGLPAHAVITHPTRHRHTRIAPSRTPRRARPAPRCADQCRRAGRCARVVWWWVLVTTRRPLQLAAS